MKLKKKTAMLVSFTLGTMLFATTALADMATKSGYEQLKDSLKVTAEKASETFDSYTLDMTFVVKDNGKTLISENQIEKYDRVQGATESLTNRETSYGEDYNNYYYSDKTMDIRRSGGDETYYVTEFAEERDIDKRFSNPFKENQAEDVERIADAIVGSLKDQVVVSENPDGSKELSGSLSEVQIPALINAVASLQVKQVFNGREQMPRLTQDIFVKEVTGKAFINPDGVLESILGTAVLSGKDEQGQIHDVSIEILGEVTGINSTTITKPVLTGDKVVKEVFKTVPRVNELQNPEKFIGQFKNDIIIEKDGKFVKIGERFVEITSLDKQTVSGRYSEEYREGFEEYATNKREFQFSGKFGEEKDPRFAMMDFTDESGKRVRGSIYLDDILGKVNFNIDYQMSYRAFDSAFIPVLD